MKNLYLIGGAMGIGKTTACQIMKKRMDASVFLDGDWCWDMNPFTVNQETKQMVLENIHFLLNQFLRCSVIENIIFCWVMNLDEIINDVIGGLELENVDVHKVSLICTESELRKRLAKDIKNGLRTTDVISRSVSRLNMYKNLDTVKIDVTNLTPEQTAEMIIKAGRHED